MRNLKFRWYDDSRNKMCSPEKIRNECDAEKEHLMQFSGVYDKNSQEIYEGDILKKESGVNDTFGHQISWHVVEFKNGGFVPMCYKMLRNQYLKMPVYDSLYLIDGIAVGYEIIGNVYQNPDILESFPG